MLNKILSFEGQNFLHEIAKKVQVNHTFEIFPFFGLEKSFLVEANEIQAKSFQVTCIVCMRYEQDRKDIPLSYKLLDIFRTNLIKVRNQKIV